MISQVRSKSECPTIRAQCGEVWSSIIIFSLCYFCLRCDNYDDTNFTPWQEKWDFGNTRTKKVKDFLAPHKRRKILNLAIVSGGGSTIERSKCLAPKFELKSR